MGDAVEGAGRRGAVSPHPGVWGVPRLVPCPAGAVPSIAAGQTGDVWETEGEEEETEEPEQVLEPIPPMPEALQPLSRRLPFPAIQSTESLKLTLTCRGQPGPGRWERAELRAH